MKGLTIMHYKFGGTVILVLAGLLVLTIIFGSWYTVDQTQRGVLLRSGWSGPVVFLQDLFVETAYRRNGVARALIARVAAHAQAIGSPMVELSVRADNPAQLLYQQSGFQVLPPCPTYVLAGPALAALAAGDEDDLPLAG
jgi:ribosomal protein S18 acetylase RimI-like enzyme